MYAQETPAQAVQRFPLTRAAVSISTAASYSSTRRSRRRSSPMGLCAHFSSKLQPYCTNVHRSWPEIQRLWLPLWAGGSRCCRSDWRHLELLSCAGNSTDNSRFRRPNELLQLLPNFTTSLLVFTIGQPVRIPLGGLIGIIHLIFLSSSAPLAPVPSGNMNIRRYKTEMSRMWHTFPFGIVFNYRVWRFGE